MHGSIHVTPGLRYTRYRGHALGFQNGQLPNGAPIIEPVGYSLPSPIPLILSLDSRFEFAPEVGAPASQVSADGRIVVVGRSGISNTQLTWFDRVVRNITLLPD